MSNFPYAAQARLLPSDAHRDHYAQSTLRRRNRTKRDNRAEPLFRHTLTEVGR